MLTRKIGLFLAGAAALVLASAASATIKTETKWTHMKDEYNGKDLVFYGHDLHKENYEAWTKDWSHHTVADFKDKVWNMDVKICMGDMCKVDHAEIWIKSGASGRYHAFYKVDGQRWHRARPVPEPAAAAVFALGLGVIGTRLRSTRK